MTTTAEELVWAESAGALCRSLSNEVRLKILFHLKGGEKSVRQLTRLLGGKNLALQPQLARLVRDHLVTVRREGRETFYARSRRTIASELVEVARALEL